MNLVTSSASQNYIKFISFASDLSVLPYKADLPKIYHLPPQEVWDNWNVWNSIFTKYSFDTKHTLLYISTEWICIYVEFNETWPVDSHVDFRVQMTLVSDCPHAVSRSS
jgi:hypothetical protein